MADQHHFQVVRSRELVIQALSEATSAKRSVRTAETPLSMEPPAFARLLKEVMMIEESVPSLRGVYLRTLSECVSFIDSHSHYNLTRVIFKSQWNLWPKEDIDSYVNFILHLVSAQSTFSSDAIRSCVTLFSYLYDEESIKYDEEEDNVDLEKLIPPMKNGHYGSETDLIIHELIKAIVRLVPSSLAKVFSTYKKQLPYQHLDNAHIRKNLRYMFAILETTTYFPILEESLLELLVSKIIQLDVRIRLEDLPDDDDEAGEDELFFPVELGSTDDISSATQKLNEVPKVALKLDLMMDAFFSYLQNSMNIQGNSQESSDKMFINLLKVFDSVILPTFQSKYTQFLMFYFTRLNSNYPEQFVGYLLNRLFDFSTQIPTRQSCAAYIASFLSRAKHVQVRIVRDSLSVLAEWIHKYLDNNSKSPSLKQHLPDVEIHSLFYSVCQAIFYVICFNYSLLFEGEKGKEYWKVLDLKKIYTCSLNPLKFCLGTVCKEFARICSLMGDHQCFEIVRNNSNKVITTAAVNGRVNVLESFFPFDPYLLSKSSRFIKDLYRTWQGAGDEEDESGVEEDPQSSYADDEDIASSLKSMSLTPVSHFDYNFHFQSSPLEC